MKRDFLLIGILLLLASCRPELDIVDNSFRSTAATLSESGETISVLFNSDSGSASLDLNASGSWTAEFVNGRAYWCTLSQLEGKRGVVTLTFTVQSNGEYDERSASVLFTCGKLQRTIVVTQKQRDALLLSGDRVEMSADGGSFTIDVQSNIDFSHRIEEDGSGWIRTVSTKGLNKSTVTFSVDQNFSLDRRSGTVTFTGTTGTEVVHVYQRGEVPTIVISDEEVSLPAEEGTFRVEVASNLAVEMLMPESCTWLRELQTKTISTQSYLFSFERNHSRSPRVCELIFRNDSFSKADTVFIVQQDAEILRSSGELYASNRGDTLSFVTAEQIDRPDLFQFDFPWIHLLGVEADTEGLRYRYRVDPNPEKDAREVRGTVSRPGFDEPELITVCQFGQQPVFSYSVLQQEVKAPEINGVSNSAAMIFWGDGTRDIYDSELVHQYAQAGLHTIRIEAFSVPFCLIQSPADGMRYDFTQMRRNQP